MVARYVASRSYRGAPKRYAGPAGAIGPIAVLLVGSSHGMDHVSRIAFALAFFALPPALVELWWKQRRRRESERLLVLPESEV